jgi:hypothetical protein
MKSKQLLRRSAQRLGFVATALLVAFGTATAQEAQPRKPPKPLAPILAPDARPAKNFPNGGSWQPVAEAAPFGAGTPLQLTDGRVLIHNSCTSDWWTLTPDASGSYVKGSWTRVDSMQKDYAPLYFSSAVLPDGRVIVNGGEYNIQHGVSCKATWTTKGAIYDPVHDTWTEVLPPTGWKTIGDAQNVVLPDGTFLLADCCTKSIARLDPAALTWSPVPTTGKSDINDEEGWTLLPDGSFLTVDAFTPKNAPSHAERYYDAAWHDAGNLVKLNDTKTAEVGPAVLMPNGKVFAIGATGHTAIYTPPTTLTGLGSWAVGPDFPKDTHGVFFDVADGPAALLPNGNVLVMASPGVFHAPSHFYEFDGHNLLQVSEPQNAPVDSSFVGRLMLLPTGQVLFTDGSRRVEIYTPTGHAKPGAKPVVTKAPKHVLPGSSYRIAGKGFNGLSQASVYGDDSSSATNYPLVRITHTANGTVTYARTYNHSSMGVAVVGKVTTTAEIPLTTPPGPGVIEVVANGIASKPVPITVGAPPPTAAVMPRQAED